jgi:hypothetical protein
MFEAEELGISSVGALRASEEKDPHLTAVCAILLSLRGRVVLLNAALDALPAACHGRARIPLERHCPLTGRLVPSVPCVMASWDTVWRPKQEGGLRCASSASRRRNECLQLKLVHRLRARVDVPWPRWAWNSAAARWSRRAWAPLEASSLRSCPSIYIGGRGRCPAAAPPSGWTTGPAAAPSAAARRSSYRTPLTAKPLFDPC